MYGTPIFDKINFKTKKPKILKQLNRCYAIAFVYTWYTF